jgi:hypothetical protein
MADKPDPDKRKGPSATVRSKPVEDRTLRTGPGGLSMRELHELVKKSHARDLAADRALRVGQKPGKRLAARAAILGHSSDRLRIALGAEIRAQERARKTITTCRLGDSENPRIHPATARSPCATARLSAVRPTARSPAPRRRLLPYRDSRQEESLSDLEEMLEERSGQP